MKYLLSQEEYDELVERGERKEEELKDTLQNLCTKVCDYMPIKFWGNEETRIWECVFSVEGEHYCDECPVKKICPNKFKHWSK